MAFFQGYLNSTEMETIKLIHLASFFLILIATKSSICQSIILTNIHKETQKFVENGIKNVLEWQKKIFSQHKFSKNIFEVIVYPQICCCCCFKINMFFNFMFLLKSTFKFCEESLKWKKNGGSNILPPKYLNIFVAFFSIDGQVLRIEVTLNCAVM